MVGVALLRNDGRAGVAHLHQCRALCRIDNPVVVAIRVVRIQIPHLAAQSKALHLYRVGDRIAVAVDFGGVRGQFVELLPIVEAVVVGIGIELVSKVHALLIVVHAVGIAVTGLGGVAVEGRRRWRGRGGRSRDRSALRCRVCGLRLRQRKLEMAVPAFLRLGRFRQRILQRVPGRGEVVGGGLVGILLSLDGCVIRGLAVRGQVQEILRTRGLPVVEGRHALALHRRHDNHGKDQHGYHGDIQPSRMARDQQHDHEQAAGEHGARGRGPGSVRRQ